MQPDKARCIKLILVWVIFLMIPNHLLWAEGRVQSDAERQARRIEFVSLIHPKFASPSQLGDVVNNRNFENRKRQYAQMTRDQWEQLKIDTEISILNPTEILHLSNSNFSHRTQLDREFYGIYRYGATPTTQTKIHLLSLIEDKKTHPELDIPTFEDVRINSGQRNANRQLELFSHLNRLFDAIQERYGSEQNSCEKANQMRDFLVMTHYTYDRERANIEYTYEYPTLSRVQALRELDFEFSDLLCRSEQSYRGGRYEYALGQVEQCRLQYKVPQMLAHCSGRPEVTIAFGAGGEVSSVDGSCREELSPGQMTAADQAAIAIADAVFAQDRALERFLADIHQSEGFVKDTCGNNIFECNRMNFRNTQNCSRWHHDYCSKVTETVQLIRQNRSMQDNEREVLEKAKKAYARNIPPPQDHLIHENSLETFFREVQGREPGINVVPYNYNQ